MLLKRQSPDGTCGGINQYTCGSDINKCCSQYGWCGDTTDHCGTKCQPSFGTWNGTSCSTTSCCSEDGYCGTTSDACSAPGCQEGYGRSEDIFNCVNPGDIALTYDDGPDVYTDGMLDVLAGYGAKATFFVTGINNGKGSIDTTPAWRDVIRKMAANGHQIASHTWSHANLTNITRYSQKKEMLNLKCMDTMKELGYHVIYFNLDTDDYNNVTPQLIQNSKNRFSNSLNGTNPASKQFLVIAHDIHKQTATNLTEFMLQTLTSKGYRAVTLGECLGDPSENWYRTVGGQVTPYH
ncbi:glycoside hydrolase/deacetylase [Wilcoxina mikolae CBS 423.85]|nr:glycoside hydrolase/deacetylase [Wilcoxina mikolae CBS 423.85]